MDSSSMHVPVMHKEVLDYLQVPAGGTVVDCTLGLAGHARSIAERLGPQGHFIGLDRDTNALAIAKENLAFFKGKCDLVHADFRNVQSVLKERGIEAVDGIVMDLGISSFQLDDPERGFSFRNDGPLDMRMDPNSFISAYDLINSLSEEELSMILKNFGEERYHHRIARYLVARRSERPIETTKELTDLIIKAMPKHSLHQKIHPATRTFQAIRIAVNRELESLEMALGKAVDCLKPGGRIAVISFHSLEDRIVKNKFKLLQNTIINILTKKPLQPGEEEMKANPRSRSAKLRVTERSA